MQVKTSFTSFDGTELVGILTIPDNKVVKVGVLMMHGIPSDKDEWGFYKDMSNELAANGCASFRFDFRYNGESESGSLDMLTLSGMVNDIDAAFWQLIKHCNNDVPIYVVGTSCGGGVTIKWINSTKRGVKHIFLMAPVLDYLYEILGCDISLRNDGENVMPCNFSTLLKEQGYLNEDIKYGRAMVNEAYLFKAVDELTCLQSPITIFQGDADTIVPYNKTVSIACEAGNRVEVVTIPGADHGFAVDGDDDLTAEGTKVNHRHVYAEMIKRIFS